MPRRVTFTEYGGPDVLKIQEVEVPNPGAKEIRVRVKAIGLNRAEAMWRSGAYVEPVNLPAGLGYECAGIVDAVGSDVTELQVGDEVTTMPAFSMNSYGVYGELVLVPAQAAVRKPSTLSFEHAVSIWNPFVTPWGAFIENGLLGAGDTVLINAASSSVGMGALQVAKLSGAKVVALSRTSAKRAQLLAAGADAVIATQEQDVTAEVNRLTDGKGATVIFEPVGGAAFAELLDAVAPSGVVIIYGALSSEATPLPLLKMIAKQITVRGYNLFNITTSPDRQSKVAKWVFDNLEAGKLIVTVSKVFAFDNIVEAHRELERNQQVGRIVVQV